MERPVIDFRLIFAFLLVLLGHGVELLSGRVLAVDFELTLVKAASVVVVARLQQIGCREGPFAHLLIGSISRLPAFVWVPTATTVVLAASLPTLKDLLLSPLPGLGGCYSLARGSRVGRQGLHLIFSKVVAQPDTSHELGGLGLSSEVTISSL